VLILAKSVMRSSRSLVVRRRVEAGLDAALGIDAVRGVAAQLEREHAGDVRGEGQRLQVEHQLDVLLERVGHANRRAGQLARLAGGVGRLDLLMRRSISRTSSR
jgi:hypothetical protein